MSAILAAAGFSRLEDRPSSAGHKQTAGLDPLLEEELAVVDTSQATMATEMRQELAQLMNSSGSHKDLAAKYVTLIIKSILLANNSKMLTLMEM